ncbi:MAG TPA: PTS glucose transporter subunit IIA, partial [Steroidobacteraceae bacterium]|nr:PTS glucose transporter subunit IIA [Steroidobacteraceae bacterium]
MCDPGAIVDIMVDSTANVTSSRLILVSPLQGWSASLDEAPDPVFAGRMLGDGLAIDPTGNTLHAPCA